MKKLGIMGVLLPFALTAAFGQSADNRQGGEDRRSGLSRRSSSSRLPANRGSCPCPYNVDRAGRMCGRRSAYSRPGGASPICYDKDVTQKMVDDWKGKPK
jgi:hypothetical protein